MVAGMLQLFSTSVYALLDPGSTLSFVTPFLARTLEIFPEVLHDPIVVGKFLAEIVRTKRVYKDHTIVLCDKIASQTWMIYQCMIFILCYDWHCGR